MSDGAGSSGAQRPPAAPAARGGRRRRLVRGVALGALCAVVLAGSGATALYLKLDGNIAGIDLDAALGGDRPEDAPHGSLDILVLGSDTRSGPNGEYGTEDRDDGREDEARADTAMIVHINEDRDAASVVSIPRDTLVERPPCERPNGSTAPRAARAMFNEAYTVGGPACLVKTVETLTDIRMDHFVEVDFKGFEELIDTLGGVEVTTTRAIRDEDSHLDLEPGTHTLDGAESLALVRTRKGVGDGSDLGRIQLQHRFVRALVEQAGDIGVFGNPKRLYDLADTATSAVTTDSALASVGELTELAETLRDIDSDALQLVTLPVVYDAADPNRVVPLEGQAERVWAALKRDRPVPRDATSGSDAEEAEQDAVVEGAAGAG